MYTHACGYKICIEWMLMGPVQHVVRVFVCLYGPRLESATVS